MVAGRDCKCDVKMLNLESGSNERQQNPMENELKALRWIKTHVFHISFTSFLALLTPQCDSCRFQQKAAEAAEKTFINFRPPRNFWLAAQQHTMIIKDSLDSWH